MPRKKITVHLDDRLIPKLASASSILGISRNKYIEGILWPILMNNETPLLETRGGPRRTSGNPFARVVNKFRHLEAYSIGSIPSRGSDGVLIVNGPDFSYEFRYFENKWEISEKIGTAHVQGRRWDCLDRFLDDVSSRHGFRKKRNPSRIIKSIKG